jgi:hypothetical protein
MSSKKSIIPESILQVKVTLLANWSKGAQLASRANPPPTGHLGISDPANTKVGECFISHVQQQFESHPTRRLSK